MDNPARFSDFAKEEKKLEGDKAKLDEILGKELLVTAFRTKKSKFKESNYTTIQFKLGDKLCIVFTGSEVLMSQLERYKDKIPFYAKIIKPGKYYTLA